MSANTPYIIYIYIRYMDAMGNITVLAEVYIHPPGKPNMFGPFRIGGFQHLFVFQDFRT